MLLDTLPNVKSLPAEQKRQLLDELWMDVNGIEQNAEQDAATLELLEKRHADYLANPESAMSLDEFHARMERFKTAYRAARG